MKIYEKQKKSDGNTSFRVLKVEDSRGFSTPNELIEPVDIVGTTFPGDSGDFAIIDQEGKLTLISIEEHKTVNVMQVEPRDLFE